MLKRRTDLALEAAAALSPALRLPGLRSRETVEEGVTVTAVELSTPQAARAAGKPMGRYVTLDLTPLRRRERAAFGRLVRVLAGEIERLLPPGEGPVLVVCLGNRNVTPDALGPLVHDHLLVTRHLGEEKGPLSALRPVAAMSLGVLGATGVESGDLAAAISEEVAPACVIAVDALAAGSLDRLCATVQLSDAGVAPGSGVGNHRRALTRETLGVPVIAVGVPTVVDAATLALDILEEAGAGELDPAALRGEGPSLYVTPRDIDQQVARCAKAVAYAIDLALQPGLTVEDLELLLE